MEAIRKQATRLREQVAKQQQAVLKQFGASGYGGSDGVVTDEGEFHQHQKLEKLYISTRAGKCLREVDIQLCSTGTKLSEDSRKYGSENTCTSGNTLSKAALNYGRARAQMEKERGSLLKAFGTQVAEPLRAMVMGAPLEDARHLAQRYDRMRQETEAQAIEVSKRQAKAREMPGHPEVTMKWEAAEAKLQDLKANMDILGKEASAAMAAVEAQQQRLTLQRLIAMVEAERNYHQRVLQILDQLESEMISERQRIEAPPTPVENNNMPPPPPYEEVNGVHATQPQNGATDSMGYFLGEVLNPYNAETDVELSLSVGDYVVVRKEYNTVGEWKPLESRPQGFESRLPSNNRLSDSTKFPSQAVLKQFGGSGYGGSDGVVTDEAELHQHQRLEKLYISTRAGKHFQRDIVRGTEGYIVTGSKQVEIGTKLSEDSRKYGSGNTCTSGNTLSKAALSYGRARAQMEKERGNMLKALGTQVAEPLRAMVMGAPLEDARHLAQRYDRMRQDAEAQAIDVSKRQAKAREMPGHNEVTTKFEAAESKLRDLKANMNVVGKEASAAMAAVEAQQQRLTLQRLIAMVEAEKNYHQRVLQILDQLETEMISERQRIEAPPTPVENDLPPPPPYEEVINNDVYASQAQNGPTDSMGYFLGEVMNTYNAETDVELSLSAGDYVVVRKVSNNGWAEGECKGKAGWFPFGYIERRDRVLASKIAEVF
ncbi:SH3 domain-containing protein 2 [Linum perenne]